MDPGTTILGLSVVAGVPIVLFFYLLQMLVIILLIRYLDIFEREPLSVVLAMFAWGGLGAVFLSIYGNGIVKGMLPEDTASLYGAALSAPFVEELAKGLALLVAFLVAYKWSRRHRGVSEFGGVTDGIVYGVAVGYGFTFVEDLLYFVQTSARGGFQEGAANFLLRADFGGLDSFSHSLYTACFGAGLGYAFWARKPLHRIAAPVVGLAAGMGLHMAWNGLAVYLAVQEFGREVVLGALTRGVLPATVTPAAFNAEFEQNQSIARWIFYLGLAGLVAVFVLWLRHERRILAYELAEEANTGVITAGEYEVLTGIRNRYRWYWQLLRSPRRGQLADVRALHDRVSDFGFLKWRIRQHGGDWSRVELARAEVKALREYVITVNALRDGATVVPQVSAASVPAQPAGSA